MTDRPPSAGSGAQQPTHRPPATSTRAASRRAASGPALLLVLASCAALVVLSTAWKGSCLDASRNFRVTCYSDVLELFTSRGLDRHVFPYVNGRLVGGEPVDTFEYPVLTGVFAWFSSLFADSRLSYLLASAVLLAPFALLTGWLLHRMAGRRALLWAAAPALVLYSLHNWDLLVVAAATSGLYAWHRGRPAWAAVLFGVGACLKIYPGLFLVPLAVDQLLRRDRTAALRVLVLGGVTIVAVNLPFLLVDVHGWATTYGFQSDRAADGTSNSIWYWLLPGLSTATLNVLTPLLALAALGAAVLHGRTRAQREGVFPVVQVCGAALVAFLLVNKVHSPQFTLWILPFLVLLRVHVGWWFAYAAADLVLYVGVFRWFYDTRSGLDDTLSERVLLAGVWAKSLLLATFFPLFLRARSAVGAQPVQRPEVNVSTSRAISGAASDT